MLTLGTADFSRRTKVLRFRPQAYLHKTPSIIPQPQDKIKPPPKNRQGPTINHSPSTNYGCGAPITPGFGQRLFFMSHSRLRSSGVGYLTRRRGVAENGGVLVEIVRRVGVRRGVLRRPEAVADGVVCVAVEACAYGSGGEFRAAASDVLPVRRNSHRASSTSLFYVRCRNHCRSSTCFILRFGVHYSRFRHHIIRIT